MRPMEGIKAAADASKHNTWLTREHHGSLQYNKILQALQSFNSSTPFNNTRWQPVTHCSVVVVK